jgi:hypothetical protein
MLAVEPIDFPNNLELRVYPHDRETGLGLPGCYPYSDHKTWEWLRATAPIEAYAWAALEQNLREGKCVPLGILGEHEIDLPDGADGPGIVRTEE